MLNKIHSCLIVCLFSALITQSAMSQQQGAEPIYYHGIAGHFDANQTYANSGLIVDKVNADSPFQKMESFETGRIRTLRVGERISSLGDGTLGSVREFNQQINQSKHRHGRMLVTVHSADGSSQEDFLVQAQPLKQNNYRLGINAAPGPNGGSSVIDVPAGSPATKMWSPTQTEKNIALEVGDEIMSVNGVAAPNTAAVIQGLSNCKNGVATLKVLNVRTGNVETFFAHPRRVNPGPKIHYVIVGQTDDRSIGEHARRNLEQLEMFTRHIRSEFIGSSQILEGRRCNAKDIKNAVSAIDSGPDDAIFVYYIGHGTYDSNGHRFALDGSDLYRKEIRQIVASKNVRLSVFLSESCNVYSAPRPQDLVQPASSNGFIITSLTKLESLFLNHRGSIEINSADTDQFGWAHGPVGGIFTFQFSRYMTSQKDNPQDWAEAINAIASRSNELQMTPKVFDFNVQSSPSGIQVGNREFVGVKPVELD